MATTVGQLDIRMNLELQRLEAQIDSANKKVASMARRMQSDVSKAAKAINTALSSFGVGLSIAGAASFGKSILDLGGKITDLANQAGLGTDSFQTFSNIAAESGVDAQQVANSFVQMRKSIQEAAEGSKTASDALGALGLKASRLQALAPERQFEEIAKAVTRATDSNKAFNAALDILGSKNAPKLTEVLQRLGKEGLDALAESTKNLRLTDAQLKTLDDAGDKLDRIWTRLKVLTAQAFVVTVDVVSNPVTSVKGPDGKTDVNPLLSSFSPGEIPAFDNSTAQGLADQIDQANRKSIDPYSERNAARKIENAEKLTKATQDAAEAAANLTRQRALDTKLDFALAEARKKDLQDQVEKGNAIYLKAEEERRANAEKTRRAEIDLDFALADSKREALRKQIEDGNKLYLDGLEKKSEAAKRFQEVNSQMWENIADRTSAALSDMLIDGESKFKDFAAGIARMIADVALRLAIINPIINGIFGLTGASALPSVFGARASGGPMSAGGTYLVGENGPELVTPTANSMVTPNHALDKVGGGARTVINADLRGASVDAVLRLEKYVRSIDATLERRAVGAVSNERRRGGGAGRTLGA